MNTEKILPRNFTTAVIGLGYIGLPTAALIASKNRTVIGVDINSTTVDTINAGKILIIEPGLEELVSRVVSEGNFSASTSMKPADVYIIAVPTPFKENHIPDISYIQTVCASLAPVLKKGNVIILESTSPVGTSEKISTWLSSVREDLTFPHSHSDNSDIRIAYCPERVLPGKVLEELIKNDRVIGGISPQCSQAALEFYDIFVEGQCHTTDAATAELCKLTENSFRDVNIAFANELSLVCDKLKINVWELIQLANHHPRVNILRPGPGVGGHCIAVDPWFIISSAPDETPLIATARKVNDHKPTWVLTKVNESIATYLSEHANKVESDITICCLGLTFKADIDDLRESPALEITTSLAESHRGRTLIVEPNIKRLPEKLINIAELKSLDDALKETDIIVILVEHREFKEKISQILRINRIIDTRGLTQYAPVL